MIIVPLLVLWLGVPVAAVGAFRQHGYGNLRPRDALLATGGGVGGVVIANAVPERALEVGFAGLILFVAAQLARGALVPLER